MTTARCTACDGLGRVMVDNPDGEPYGVPCGDCLGRCTCGHPRSDHGRADAQTAWQSLCWRDDCECDGFADNDDPCWTCGGRGCEDCRMRSDQRCSRCRNYPDTPGHYYGCDGSAAR